MNLGIKKQEQEFYFEFSAHKGAHLDHAYNKKTKEFQTTDGKCGKESQTQHWQAAFGGSSLICLSIPVCPK